MTRRLFRGFSDQTFHFFRNLRENNNRDWFEEHRGTYQEHVLNPLKHLVQDMAGFMEAIDPGFVLAPKVPTTISRINRDTRFSRDKSPYRANMWIVFQNPGIPVEERPGFFLELYEDKYRYGMGFYGASQSKMDEIRAKIEADPSAFEALVGPIISEHEFELCGDKYKQSLASHLPESIRDWYDRKSFHLQRSRAEVSRLMSPELTTDLEAAFEALRPLYWFLTGRA